MADLKHAPARHDHKSLLEKAANRRGFAESYEALEPKYEVIRQLLKSRARAGLTQDAVAERMGTTKSAISRLEGTGKHAPSLTTLRRYAQAVGCQLQIKLVPLK